MLQSDSQQSEWEKRLRRWLKDLGELIDMTAIIRNEHLGKRKKFKGVHRKCVSVK